MEAVRWFTCTILHQTTTTTHSYKKPWTLGMLHDRWTSTLNRTEDLTHRHPHGVTQAYQYACWRVVSKTQEC